MNVNDYQVGEQLQILSEENLSVYKRGDYEKNQISYIHNSSVLLMIEEGEAEYYIKQKKYQVKSGDIIVIGAEEYYRRRITKVPYIRYGFAIMPRYYSCVLDDVELLDILNTPDLDTFIRFYKNINKDLFIEMLECLQQLNGEKNGKAACREQMQRALVLQIIILLYRAVGHETSRSHELNQAHERVHDMRKYINDNCSEELNLKVLSEIFYLHPTTISKDFSLYCNSTLNKYINTVRIREASKLLETQNYSVEVISSKVGYKNVNTFIRQFKTRTGVTPLEYKKSLIKLETS